MREHIILIQSKRDARLMMFLGHYNPAVYGLNTYVTEYPDAHVFNARRDAIKAAQRLALDMDISAVYIVTDYGTQSERRTEICK